MARLVKPSQAIGVSGPPPRYVSRGGTKLEAALDRFTIDVAGRRASDVGAGTGGFTDCLLQRGVTSVVTVDVGRAQLHERLRSDPRVEVCERTDIRELDPGVMGAPFGMVVADLSFISLRTVMADLLGLVDTGSSMVLEFRSFLWRRAEALLFGQSQPHPKPPVRVLSNQQPVQRCR